MSNRNKQSYPAAERNSPPILEALRKEIGTAKPGKQLLEIASGTGQHSGYFAPHFPSITFQPTEYDRQLLKSIAVYAMECPTKNIKEPLFVDITKDPNEWNEAKSLQVGSYDYMFNSNMVHLTPWSCSEGLFRAAQKMLKPHGRLFMYGPYALNGVLTPQSNVDFDLRIKRSNPEYGVRDIADLKNVAEKYGLELKNTQEMPSNNKFLTWAKVK